MGVRKRKEGGLIIEAAAVDYLRKIMENPALKESGYEVAKLGSRNAKRG